MGTTPYQIVKKLKEERTEYAESTISYAGRLDPMAEGVLILLIDKENKKREEYQSLDKEYKFKVLFGLETDTYDLLGMVKNEPRTSENAQVSINKELVKDYIKNLVGKRKQKYPPFSSYRIDGKPLFQWAKEGKINEIKIPEKEIIIFESHFLKSYKLEAEKLRNLAISCISKVEGKFRQKEIIKRWKNYFRKSRVEEFPVMQFKITCSSGTYIRGIANNLGKLTSTGALSLHIKRTRVGKYKIKNAQKL